MRKLNLKDAKELILRAVGERGSDYNYKENFELCTYSQGGAPACLVGLALSYIEKDWDIEHLLQHATDAGGDILSTRYALREAGMLDISKPAAMFLKLAQSQQDMGKTWGEAYDIANIFYFAHQAMTEV